MEYFAQMRLHQLQMHTLLKQSFGLNTMPHAALLSDTASPVRTPSSSSISLASSASTERIQESVNADDNIGAQELPKLPSVAALRASVLGW
mmetsp:Transcript_88174/g.234455  ORF Transcript_88174/g.234455 Transcript_88174/m.234455 type:complete len:91 (-) Transcript_88174:388-660(-)